MTITIVLAGAPGAGKTMLANALGAVGGRIEQDPSGASRITTRTASREYVFLDVPAGAVDRLLAQAQGLVLVVSAADGSMPATKQHAMAGVPIAAVYLNAAGVEDPELVDLVEMEVRELVTAAGHHGGDTIAVVRTDQRSPGHGEPDPSYPLRMLADALDRFFVQS